jgi:hypothetical protein
MEGDGNMDQPLGGNSQAPTALAAPERNQYFRASFWTFPIFSSNRGISTQSAG